MVKTYCSYDIRLIALEEECKNINELPIRHRPDKRSVIRQTPQHTAPLLVICHENLFIARLSLLLYGCTTFPQAVKPTTGGQPYPTEIYIVSHGWHTGIIAPAHDVNTVLPQLKKTVRSGDAVV